MCFNPLSAKPPRNGQTHSNNSSAKADELFEYVWPSVTLELKGLNNITCGPFSFTFVDPPVYQQRHIDKNTKPIHLLGRLSTSKQNKHNSGLIFLICHHRAIM